MILLLTQDLVLAGVCGLVNRRFVTTAIDFARRTYGPLETPCMRARCYILLLDTTTRCLDPRGPRRGLAGLCNCHQTWHVMM